MECAPPPRHGIVKAFDAISKFIHATAVIKDFPHLFKITVFVFLDYPIDHDEFVRADFSYEFLDKATDIELIQIMRRVYDKRPIENLDQSMV